jgi:putative ABC transport system permease protein
MPIGGVPVTFRIVGRFIDPSDDGEVLAYGRDTLAEAGAAAPPIFYDLLLRNGVSQDAARAWLLHKSGNRLDVEETTDQASQLSAMRLLIAGLIGILVLIGLTNLTTAAAVGRRDHLRDVRVLEALGLTPLQVRASLVTRTAVLALVAVALGALAGLLASPTLINLLSELYGIGSGLGRSPSGLAIAVAVAVAVIAAGLTATIPARRADRLPVSELLG